MEMKKQETVEKETKGLTDDQKIRLARNLYQRDWQRRNRKRQKEIENKHWLKRFEELQEQGEIEVEDN